MTVELLLDLKLDFSEDGETSKPFEKELLTVLKRIAGALEVIAQSVPK